MTEVSSALAMKLRTKALTLDQRAAGLGAWNAMRAASMLTLAVTDEHFEAAAQIVDNHALGLRSGDALHIAIVREAGHRLATFDARMAGAVRQLGVAVEPI